MVTSIIIEHGDEAVEIKGTKTIQQLNYVLQVIAAAYSDDPGTSDLDDEQPSYPIRLTLGDVRLARRLAR